MEVSELTIQVPSALLSSLKALEPGWWEAILLFPPSQARVQGPRIINYLSLDDPWMAP